MTTATKKEHKSARPERGGQATLLEAIRQGIWEEMERDPTVFVIGEDVGAYGGAFKVTDGLLDEFGSGRVIDTPISITLQSVVIAGAQTFPQSSVDLAVRACAQARFTRSTPRRSF
jgi:hypothetical protein